jgi:hypothetical protein
MTVKRWLLLIYRIPREPSAGRVHVWRKLKQLGAIAMQNAAWVLPQNTRTREQFQWLSAEITELGGDVTLFEANQVYATEPDVLEQQFRAMVDTEYQNILSSLKKKNCDLGDLSKRFQDVLQRDHFRSELSQQTRQALLTAAEGQKI